jgi:hypothetical protein
MKKVNVKIFIMAVSICLSAFACGGGSTGSGLSGGGPKFDGEYKYNPPTDNYYIKWTRTWAYGDDNKTKSVEEFVARIGDGFASNPTDEIVTYIDYSSGKGWSREINGTNWSPDDYDYSTEPGEENTDIGILSSMENYFLKYFRGYGFDNEKLKEYYVGNEKVAGVNCWVFDSKGLNAIYMKYWIDPSNGCCLKVMSNDPQKTHHDVEEVTVYNLKYTEWADNLKYTE